MAPRKPLDVRTLLSVARRVASSESAWRKSAGQRPTETYGSGFAHGMAEMARRIKVDCRERARTQTPAKKRKR